MARIAALTAELDDIVAATADANVDDEHDPEGSTIAFERARVSTLLSQGRRRTWGNWGTRTPSCRGWHVRSVCTLWVCNPARTSAGATRGPHVRPMPTSVSPAAGRAFAGYLLGPWNRL